MATDERSARVRRLSDQLKPSPDEPEGERGVSVNLEKDELTVRRRWETESGASDKPRPLVSREEIVPFCAVAAFLEAVVGDLVPFCPGLPGGPPPPPPPDDVVRISLNARAPKLVRRVKGVLFGSRAGAASSSAMADSSTLPLLAEPMLSRRPPRMELKGEVELFGEPERPRLVMDIRRR